MNYQIRPLTLNPDQLSGLSGRYSSPVTTKTTTRVPSKRLNALRGELAALDWNAAAAFTINGLKREELIAANSAFLHELYFDNLGGNGVLPSCGLSIALTRDFGSIEAWRSQFIEAGQGHGRWIGMGTAVLCLPVKADSNQPLGHRPRTSSCGRQPRYWRWTCTNTHTTWIFWRQGGRLCGCFHGQHPVGQGLQALRALLSRRMRWRLASTRAVHWLSAPGRAGY